MAIHLTYRNPDPITGDWDPWAMMRNIRAIEQFAFNGISGLLGVGNGGTGIISYTIGDILYASGVTTLSKLADVAAGNALISGGVGVAPLWGKIGLTTHVSGDLPYANLAQGSALSVLGVTGNATADVASIAAGTDNFVLRRAGTALAFGTLVNANIDAAAALAFSKFAHSGARVYNSANISIPDSTQTALTYDSERYDTDSYHSTSSNTSRITMPIAGIYGLTAHVRFASSALGTRQVVIQLNGTTPVAVYETDPVSTAGRATDFSVAVLYKFAANDYVEVVVYQTTGLALNVSTGSNFSPEFATALLGV